MTKFEDLIGGHLLDAIKRMGLETPTEIQTKTIPLILKGQDVIGESATGSGKTLAFGCGVVQNVTPGKGVQALILTPTRELAEQVTRNLIEISHGKSLKIISVYGGVAINPQFHALKTADVVVGTPGRLLDHIGRRSINLSKVKLLVLDEADRMLEMGFIEDVEQIIRECSPERQTLFFSATIVPRIQNLAKRYMQNPIKVQGIRMVDPKKLKQVYYDVSRHLKISLLVHLLKSKESYRVMVFCNTRNNTDFVAKNLKINGVKSLSIHGGLTQNKRAKTIEQFNKTDTVLVCTDVAARGLHIDNVSHVYNYDIPRDPTEYVHRIGRTARAGEEGSVINLLVDVDHDNFSRVMYEHRDFKIEKAKTPKVEKVNTVKTPSTPKSFGSRGPRRGQGRQSRNRNRRR